MPRHLEADTEFGTEEASVTPARPRTDAPTRASEAAAAASARVRSLVAGGASLEAVIADEAGRNAERHHWVMTGLEGLRTDVLAELQGRRRFWTRYVFPMMERCGAAFADLLRPAITSRNAALALLVIGIMGGGATFVNAMLTLAPNLVRTTLGMEPVELSAPEEPEPE